MLSCVHIQHAVAATFAGASSGIMSTPCIVFLDEPTSGLDSYAALSVMAYMRGMASAGSQTVISSIHQPRAAIWTLYDKVCQAGCVRVGSRGITSTVGAHADALS